MIILSNDQYFHLDHLNLNFMNILQLKLRNLKYFKSRIKSLKSSRCKFSSNNNKLLIKNLQNNKFKQVEEKLN